MKIKSIRDSSAEEINQVAVAFVTACGYEARACSFARKLDSRVTKRYSIVFKEWPDALSRKQNEEFLVNARFQGYEVAGSDSLEITRIMEDIIEQAGPGPLAIDISSMTRAWHGGIVRTLRNLNRPAELETYFAYTPAKFSRPPNHSPANEIVAPVDGFASLATPELPVALVLGLGYERDRALGLQQLLDPKKTILMIPRVRTREDRFHDAILKANQDILSSTPRKEHYEYWLDEPSAAFGELASIISGLTPAYRVVIASLGPKLFGLVCFLLATRFPEISIWRASSGRHGHPRQSFPDSRYSLVLNVTWRPD